jgi:aryl-alcohol dehydrogenase-like predicted oxidoreductase
LEALDGLVKSGKVRHIGCSNYKAWQMVDAQWTSEVNGWASFISCQDEYSLLRRDLEAEAIPAMQAKGVGLLPYFPLASGMLTGKYKRGEPLPEGTRFSSAPGLVDRYMTDENWDTVERAERFAEGRGKKLLDVAFAWLLAQKPVASVIAGATKPEQVAANVAAGSWILTGKDLDELAG